MSEPGAASSSAAGAAAAAGAGLVEGIGSEVVVCVFILLAGLILVAAWLSTYVPQDARPIAVFVFENFGRNRPAAAEPALEPPPAATPAIAPAPEPAASSITGPPPFPPEEPPSTLPTLPPPQPAAAAAATAATAEAASAAPASTAELATYDVDVLESDGDLDPEMRERVEDVLQEYTQVMEAKNDSELRNRRLKYFNCLLSAQPGSSAAAGAASSSSTSSSAAAAVTDDASADAPAASSVVDVNGEPTTEATSQQQQQQQPPSSATSTVEPSMPPPPPAAAAPAATATAAAATDAGAPRPPGSLLLRLKYFNDDLRTVVAQPTESITNFKRKHFQLELSRNMNIRLIYNGRELKEGTDRTLASYAIPQEATIHCLITERSGSADEAAGATANGTAADAGGGGQLEGQGDIGSYMFPLFGGILGIIWYCRVCYKAYFNFMSTMALGAVTLLFFAAFFASWSARPPRQSGQIHVHRINLDAQQQQQQQQQEER